MAAKRSSDESQSSQTSPKIVRLAPDLLDSVGDINAAAATGGAVPRISAISNFETCNSQVPGSQLCLDAKLSRREKANYNERRRMHSINYGFELVKSEIPSIAKEKASKVIIFTSTYSQISNNNRLSLESHLKWPILI